MWANVRRSSSLNPWAGSRLANRIHATYGIAVSVNRPDGDRRTFDRQHHLLTTSPGVTGAGAGESLHCYGYAADLGFKGLQWLQANGAAVDWLSFTP
ncbi:MAG TPA: hypothetical protein VJV78_37630 [Polyangiales bacterium]|nr:hypothetical protein [Polyangiales bacterium]